MVKRSSGASIDALALTFVRIITVLISMVIYKLLAVCFSVNEYGTYASAMLIATTTTSLTIFGLTDAINYFYVKDQNADKGKVYVYTIFFIQFIVGFFSAVLFILLRNQIAIYFKNPSVANLIPGVALIPLLTNISSMLQILFVTAQKAKAIAIRNLIVAVLKVIFVILACLWINNIHAVIIIILALDIGNVIYMLIYCKRNIFSIKLRKANFRLVGEILKYSIPMAAYVLTNAMSKNIDKLIIGALGTPGMMGMYSIAAKELPFDILTTSFLTVLIPYITRYIGNKDYKNASAVFSKYIQITYIITWIFTGGALVCANDIMLILYDSKYLPGLGVFCLYIIVDMMKFANISIVFSISNKAKELLCYSGVALALNTILNIVFYKFWGMIGPAVATVIITFLLSCVIMIRSANLLQIKVLELLNYKQMVCLIYECIICGVVAFAFKNYLASRISPIFTVALTCSIYGIPLLLINYKKIIFLLKEINRTKLI